MPHVITVTVILHVGVYMYIACRTYVHATIMYGM